MESISKTEKKNMAQEILTKCPHCYTENPLLTDTSGGNRKPRPGDINICFQCLQISIFGEEYKLELPSPNFFTELPPKDAEELRMYIKELQLRKISS